MSRKSDVPKDPPSVLPRSQAGTRTPMRLISVSQPAPGIRPAEFLKQAMGKERFYWVNGRRALIFAGFGVTANLMAWGEDRFQSIGRKARELFADAVVDVDSRPSVQPRLFGGFAFRDDFAPDNTWSVFHPAHFILPHYQLTTDDEGSWMTINALVPLDEDQEESRLQLHEALTARIKLMQDQAQGDEGFARRCPEPLQVNYPMPYETWERKILHATQYMRSSELNKVVLSRVCEIRFDDRVDVDGALSYLDEHYPDCYRFLFEPRPFHAFFGATPELLAEVNGPHVTTMAMASSVRRGMTEAEDEELAQQLLADPKERYEHTLVVDAIRRRLGKVTSDLNIPGQPAVYRLSNIQHLHTPVQGVLREATGVLPVVEILHPTPALGGSPRQLAMAFISEAEPVPRGWYAAPVGCIDRNLDGVFGVAIRSAVSQERRVWLYAGAGIVADSVPRKEWDETALKFKPILNALNLEITA